VAGRNGGRGRADDKVRAGRGEEVLGGRGGEERVFGTAKVGELFQQDARRGEHGWNVGGVEVERGRGGQWGGGRGRRRRLQLGWLKGRAVYHRSPGLSNFLPAFQSRIEGGCSLLLPLELSLPFSSSVSHSLPASENGRLPSQPAYKGDPTDHRPLRLRPLNPPRASNSRSCFPSSRFVSLPFLVVWLRC
jgi:hypothetical protein